METKDIITLITVLVLIALIATIIAMSYYCLYRRGKLHDANCVASQETPGRQTSGLSVDSSIFRETLRDEQDNNCSLDISTTTNISLEYDAKAGSLMFSSSSQPHSSPYHRSTPLPHKLEFEETIKHRCQNESSMCSISLPTYQRSEIGSLLESILEEVGEKVEENKDVINQKPYEITSPFRCLPFTPALISSYSLLPVTKDYLEDDIKENKVSRNISTKSSNPSRNVLENQKECHQDYSHSNLSFISEAEYNLDDITDILEISGDDESIKSSAPRLTDINYDEKILPIIDNKFSREEEFQSPSSCTDIVSEDGKYQTLSRPFHDIQSPSCPLLYRVLVNADKTSSKFISLSI